MWFESSPCVGCFFQVDNFRLEPQKFNSSKDYIQVIQKINRKYFGNLVYILNALKG